MSNYHLRARIPQELADEMFQTIKMMQERESYTGADISTSTITRAAVEMFVKYKKGEYLGVKFDPEQCKPKDILSVLKVLEAQETDENTDGEKYILQQIQTALTLLFVNEQGNR